MTSISIRWTHLAALLLVSLTTGCAQIQLGAPVASIDNIQKAKASGMPAASVGNFALAAGKPAEMDKGVSVRSNTVSSPYDQSFAKYLKETLTAELKAAGLLDAAAPLSIQGELVDSVLDAPIGVGKGKVSARFTATRAGKKVFEKDFTAESTWESSFVGAVAIPAAVNQYSQLYRQVVGQLLDDAGFRAAVK